jgi:hypothetical protein
VRTEKSLEENTHYLLPDIVQICKPEYVFSLLHMEKYKKCSCRNAPRFVILFDTKMSTQEPLLGSRSTKFASAVDFNKCKLSKMPILATFSLACDNGSPHLETDCCGNYRWELCMFYCLCASYLLCIKLLSDDNR